MPFKDKQRSKDYQKKYNQKRVELIHQAKAALGIPINRRLKPKLKDQEPTD